MNASTLNSRETTDWDHAIPNPRRFVDLEQAETPMRTPNSNPGPRRGFFQFVNEMRRRQVCRAATTYCIALWLICQVVEVIEPQIGLPEWTLRLVIVLGLLGFPIALIISWLFEITPAGLVLDAESAGGGIDTREPGPRSRFDQAIDCGLLFVALAIGSQLAITGMNPKLMASTVPVEQVSVRPFPVTAASNADAFSRALMVELQHEIARRGTYKVVVPRDPAKVFEGSSISGSVAVLTKVIHVTAVVVDNRSGELTWSEVLSFPIKGNGGTPRDIAKGIAAALEGWSASIAMEDKDDLRSEI